MTGSVEHQAAVPLQLDNVSKLYRVYDSPRSRLKSLLTGKALHRSHWALKDVSLELRRGQCLGVVGSNGAGKSTLLKLITGTVQPSQGRVTRQGRVTAILELGAGFHPDFTGRQNLYFGGSLIGISHDQMAHLESEVLAFAEIGDAIDRPVKTYSSGMVVRLAFALVTAVEPDLLIIDEALAVGDQHFQRKCIERIERFKRNGCTILFCSHSPYHVRQLCDVALWLDRGTVMEFGPTEPVIGAYEMHTRLLHNADTETPNVGEALVVATDDVTGGVDPRAVEQVAPHPSQQHHVDASAAIIAVEVAHLADGEPPLLDSRDLIVTITVRGRGDEQPNIGFMIEQSKGVGITSLATHEEGAVPTCIEPGVWRSVLTFPSLPLHSGQYVISAYLFDRSGLVVYDQWYQFFHFRFVMPTLMPGLVKLPHHWS